MSIEQAESWDDRFQPPVRGLTIHEMFDGCAERWPDSVAVRSGGVTYTYRQLRDASGQCAAELEDRGVDRGRVVPVIMDRSPEFFAVLLAVLRRGAAYVVLDATWPQGRLRDIVGQVDAPVVVTSDRRSWGHLAFQPTGLYSRVATGPARTAAPVEVGPDDPCAIFFTSGSTGPAKGVITAHRGHVRLFDDWPFAPYGSGVIMPQSASATWDAFSLDGWATLLGGGTAILVDSAATLMEQLRQLVETYAVNTVWVPTAVFHTLVESRLDAFAGLRAVGTGGERLSPAHVRRFQQQHPDVALYNFYGPVECTVVVTMARLASNEEADGEVPLGRPLGSSGIHVLGGDRPCGLGEIGEICLSGPGLARGYLGDEQLTASKFVELDVDGVTRTVYRTGDLGHLDCEGNLYFDGRVDRQVKLRGRRIDLDALEQVAGTLQGVGSNAVVQIEGEDRLCKDLCLFYVGAGSPGVAVEAPSESKVRRALLDRLPAYMVPAFVHHLEVLPVAQDRKVDRARLTTLAQQLRKRGAAGDEPVGDTETQLAAVFRSLLGISGAVSRKSSFFNLGGNSLNAAQLAVLIEERFGVRIKLSQIFSSATVASLAAVLDAREQ